ncbi:MAG TPA: hypothetical protein VE974_06150 [Thermoanaerobaculia bacterium]|nr:hypothetical protein [Thermoanaerobaculia bacterium]
MAGKPGRSGRKGAGREFADFEKLWQQWSDPKFIESLIERNFAGKQLSIQERFLLRAYDGLKERDAVLFKKLFPDTNRLEGGDGGPLIVTWQK